MMMMMMMISNGVGDYILGVKSSTSISFGFEQIIKPRRTCVFIKPILRFVGQNDLHRVYDPVHIRLR